MKLLKFAKALARVFPMHKNSVSHQASLPKISVITIVRNGVPFVEQTIDSVLSQSYLNSEYIVIDGGSTDGTLDFIKSRESGITKWVSEKDEGIADAFNKGLSFSTGDYRLFLNSDDFLAGPDVMVDMAAKIVENKFPPLIYGDCDVLDRDSDKVLYRAIIKVSRDGLRRGQMPPHPSLFANRSYFEKYGSFDARFKIAMDYEWLLRGGLKERIVHVPLLVTNVRTGGISTLDQSRAEGEIISALKKNGHISSKWGEIEMRGYFSARSLIKAMLKSMGLYKLFVLLRNKRANPTNAELKNGRKNPR
jgi:glycosyltransferase involved in cell wall biosynthesis